MAQVVQANCPYCKKVLRIPTEWIAQTMRCKFCRKTFQAKGKAGAAPPAPLYSSTAVAPAVAAAAASDEPFNFQSGPPAPRVRRPSSPGFGKPIVLGCGVLAIGAVILGFLGTHLANVIKPLGSKDQVALADAAGKKNKDGTRDDAKTDKTSINDKANDKSDFTKSDKGVSNGDGGQDSVKPSNPGDPDVFPRRGLIVSVNDYLLANPLAYGGPQTGDPSKGGFPGSSTRALLDKFGNFPLHFPNTQLVELSDSAVRDPYPPVKETIQGTLTEFLTTSRMQDRVVVLFTGHAVEIDKEAFLVPLEGSLEDPKTLISLTWVYDQLKECKARQKILILDVCRFNQARGNERPGGDEMGEILDAKLLQPPAGVQVWSSCVKGQQSYEFESGSLFLQALCRAMHERLADIQTPASPIPVELLVSRVNVLLEKALKPYKLTQLSRLSGAESQGGTPLNTDAKSPPTAVVKRPPAPAGDQFANKADVERILRDLNAVPPPRATGRGAKEEAIKMTSLPVFSAKVLQEYRDDGALMTAFAGKMATFPLRAAIGKAALALQQSSQSFTMKDKFFGGSTAQVKKDVLREQSAPGKVILFLEEALDELKLAGKARDEETSKRWQANYDYVLARLESRLVYIMEYNYVLAQIRSDSLPALEAGFSGYRLGAQQKVTIPESKVKDWVKEIRRTWEKIAEDYPGTPWAVVAQRERLTVLGLQWRPTRQ